MKDIIWVFFSLLFGFSNVFPAWSQTVIPSGLEDETLSILHTVGIKSNSWLKEIYPAYKREGRPPDQWAATSQRSHGGIWFNFIGGQKDLKAAKYWDLIPKVHFSRRTVAERNILVLANVKPDAIWWKGNDGNWKTWEKWINLKENQERPNRFHEDFKYSGFPWHSAFYDDHRIVGVLDNGNVPVVQNLDLLEETAVFIPPRFARLANGQEREEIIYTRASERKFLSLEESESGDLIVCAGVAEGVDDLGEIEIISRPVPGVGEKAKPVSGLKNILDKIFKRIKKPHRPDQ